MHVCMYICTPYICPNNVHCILHSDSLDAIVNLLHVVSAVLAKLGMSFYKNLHLQKKKQHQQQQPITTFIWEKTRALRPSVEKDGPKLLESEDTVEYQYFVLKWTYHGFKFFLFISKSFSRGLYKVQGLNSSLLLLYRLLFHPCSE